MTILVVKFLALFLVYGCANLPVFDRSQHTIHEATKVRATPAAGPLRINALNPRYFTDGSGRAIYLTGSHHWNNLVDQSGKADFEFGAYLDFLVRHKHNFIRLWTKENTAPGPDPSLPDNRPLPYQRTGPQMALDGKPKFDLTKFNAAYFERLRARVKQAGDRGIYVMVMLFHGFHVHHKGGSRKNPWPSHPFHSKNNVNAIDGDGNGNGEGDEVHTLRIPAVTRIQEAYVQKVVDTLNDLDNVLYEISNESHRKSVEWQYHLIRFIQEYQSNKPRQHPVVMTFMWDGESDEGNDDNAALFASPATAISPGPGPQREYQNDPPPADGSKIIISDSDHLGLMDEDWVWKSFLRGLNPTLMDHIEDPSRERVRKAMGQTLTVAKRINLVKMFPRKDLASSGYCLANPGVAYLVYLPSNQQDESRTRLPHSVEVALAEASGTFNVEWFNPSTDEFTHGGKINGGAKRSLTAPFVGPALLYLAATEVAS